VEQSHNQGGPQPVVKTGYDPDHRTLPRIGPMAVNKLHQIYA